MVGDVGAMRESFIRGINEEQALQVTVIANQYGGWFQLLFTLCVIINVSLGKTACAESGGIAQAAALQREEGSALSEQSVAGG